MYIVLDINNNKTWSGFNTVTEAIEFCTLIAKSDDKYAILIKQNETVTCPPSYSISIPC